MISAVIKSRIMYEIHFIRNLDLLQAEATVDWGFTMSLCESAVRRGQFGGFLVQRLAPEL